MRKLFLVLFLFCSFAVFAQSNATVVMPDLLTHFVNGYPPNTIIWLSYNNKFYKLEVQVDNTVNMSWVLADKSRYAPAGYLSLSDTVTIATKYDIDTLALRPYTETDPKWIADSSSYYKKTYVGNHFTPQTRMLTINGTTYDLSDDRSWSVLAAEVDPYSFHKADSNTVKNPITLKYFNDHNGVTSVTAGKGLSGGTIISSGTIRADTSFLETKTHSALTYEPIVTEGTSGQYWSWDKTWRTPGSVKSVKQGYGVAFSITPLVDTGTIKVDTSGANNPASKPWVQTYVTNRFQTKLTNPITGTGTVGYLPNFSGTSSLGDSPVYTDGRNVGIGCTPYYYFDVAGNIRIQGSNSLRFGGGTGAGTDYLYSPSSGTLSTASNFVMGSTLTINGKALVFPSGVGANNYVLTTDGAGNLSWSDKTGGTPGTISSINGSSAAAQTLNGTLPIQVVESGIGSYIHTISIKSDTLTVWYTKQNKGSVAYDTNTAQNTRLKKLERDSTHWNTAYGWGQWHDTLLTRVYQGTGILVTGSAPAYTVKADTTLVETKTLATSQFATKENTSNKKNATSTSSTFFPTWYAIKHYDDSVSVLKRNLNNHDSLSMLDEKSYNSLTDKPTSWAISNIMGLTDSLNNRYRRLDTANVLLGRTRAASTYQPKGSYLTTAVTSISTTSPVAGGTITGIGTISLNTDSLASWARRKDTATIFVSKTRFSHPSAFPTLNQSTTGQAGSVSGTLTNGYGINTLSFNGSGSTTVIADSTHLWSTVRASHVSSYPTLNQNTTGTAGGLTSQYIDWNASSGGSSIANKPTIGTGTVTSITMGYGLSSTQSPLTTTGTMKADSTVLWSTVRAGHLSSYPTFNQSTTGQAGSVGHTLGNGYGISTLSFNGSATATAIVDTSVIVSTVRHGHASSYPTLNQNTTGTAAGLTAQYIDFNSTSGGNSIKNLPTTFEYTTNKKNATSTSTTYYPTWYAMKHYADSVSAAGGTFPGFAWDYTHAARGSIIDSIPVYHKYGHTALKNPADTLLLNQVQINSNAATEAPAVGSELLTSSGWTSTGWTGSYGAGFTHTAGNVSGLSRAVTYSSATQYAITFTMSGRTAGFLTVTFGGTNSTGPSSHVYPDVVGGGAFPTTIFSFGPTTINNTDPIVFVPTTDFNGTISNISIKAIAAPFSAPIVLKNSTGTTTFETRSYSYPGESMYIGTNAGGYTLPNNCSLGNLAVGYNALKFNTSGNYVTGIGDYACWANTNGRGLTAVGFGALQDNITGDQNTAIGVSALGNNISGYNNFAGGVEALHANTTGSFNTAIGGYDAMLYNTTGSHNVAYGHDALLYNIDQDYNTAIGTFALESNTAPSNTAVGGMAGYLNTTGTGLTALGYLSLANSRGNNNTGIGQNALTAVTSSGNSTGVGYYALGTTIGGFNTAVGSQSNAFSTAGDYNTTVGFQSLYNSGGSASYNTFLGAFAGYGITGSRNIGIGYDVFDAVCSGNDLIGIGTYSLANATLASSTVAIGYESGQATTINGGGLYLGYASGKYETAGNTFYINNIDQTNTANEKAYSLLYGTFAGSAGTTSGNSLTVNGTLQISNIPTLGSTPSYALAYGTNGQISKYAWGGGGGGTPPTAGYRIGVSGYTVNNTSYWGTQDSLKSTLTGLVLATYGKLTTVTNNSSNWNTAYGWGNWAHTTLSGYGITDAWGKSDTTSTLETKPNNNSKLALKQTIANLVTTTGTSTTKYPSQATVKAQIDSVSNTLWRNISCTYASAATCTMTGGTQLMCDEMSGCIIQWLSSAGVMRVGVIESATVTTGTITLTVRGTVAMASGDKSYAWGPTLLARFFERRITIPGYLNTDATNPVGTWFRTGVDSTYVFDFSAWTETAASGTGAACAFQVYGPNAIFSSPIDLTTNTSSLDNIPTTPLISPNQRISMRITSAVGATSLPADFQLRFYSFPTRKLYAK